MRNTHTAPLQFNDIVCNSIRNLDGLVFFGDPHGQFAKLLRTGLAETTKCLFILGDFFDREFDEVRSMAYAMFSTNSNESDDLFHYRATRCRFSCTSPFYEEFADHNLNGRIVTVGTGLRVAGLVALADGLVPTISQSSQHY